MKLLQPTLDYLEKYKSLTLVEIGNAVVIGVLFSLAFVFLSRGESINDLVYDTFRLPHPGAGIALIVGPVAIMCGLLAHSFNPKPGSILFSVLVFGLLVPIGGAIFNPDGLGQFPFFFPLLSFIVLAILLEIFAYMFSKRDDFQKVVTPAVLTNILFLVFWWLTIFPIYLDEWPLKKNVEVTGFGEAMEYISPILILIGVGFIGALVVGAIIPLIVSSMRSKKAKDTSS
jgi:hypothetical protein